MGKDTFDDSLAALRPRGMMVLYGAVERSGPAVRPAAAEQRRIAVPHPAHPGALHRRPRPNCGGARATVFDWIAKGELDVRIGGTYPLSEAARAQEDLASRRTTGKLLLLPGL